MTLFLIPEKQIFCSQKLKTIIKTAFNAAPGQIAAPNPLRNVIESHSYNLVNPPPLTWLLFSNTMVNFSTISLRPWYDIQKKKQGLKPVLNEP